MRTLIIFTFLTVLLFPVYGQTRDELMDTFNEGLYFMNRGDYKEAAFYFRKMTDKYPENANYNFKLGECYMNVPGSEALAVPCFEKAVKQIVPKKKYNKKDFDGKSAPLYAWFYLGNVYRISNRLDEALKAYDTFINSPFYFGDYNQAIVENEIKACERAKIIQDNPVPVSEVKLDTMINTDASELYPVVSRDERTLVFVRRLKFYDAIYITEKNGDAWSQPVNLNTFVGSDGDLYPTCLSADNKELYLVKFGESKDIWISRRTDSGWSKANPLDGPINTSADESSACLSEDGKSLYFASTRKGGYGGSDLYVSRRDTKNQWGKPRNLGSMINTAFDEESPWVTNHDTTLFFSSKGHFSMGGYDIFYSNLSGKKWSEPVNLGFPINNTGDNLGYIALPGGKKGYYSKVNPEEPNGESDIFRVEIK
jgi:tetratricopeptide (TPR) repeat protein